VRERSDGAGDTGRLSSRPAVPSGADEPHAGLLRLGGNQRGDHVLLVPDARRAARRLLVFFHGAGGTAADSIEVLSAAATRHHVVLLLPTSAGATWDLLAGGLGPDVAALDDLLGSVFGSRPIEEVAFGGFSDGGSYALSLALANGDLASAVLAFSPGFVAPPGQVGAPRVWISHGTGDRVLPVERCGRRVSRTLAQAGYDVRYEEFSGGHVITPALVDAATAWWFAGSPEAEE
jgi:phospholipase/carboxylesterase